MIHDLASSVGVQGPLLRLWTNRDTDDAYVESRDFMSSEELSSQGVMHVLSVPASALLQRNSAESSRLHKMPFVVSSPHHDPEDLCIHASLRCRWKGNVAILCRDNKPIVFPS